MAYMSQEKKQEIKQELIKVIPKGWKWSLAVKHHSTLVLNISSAPVDLIGEALNKDKYDTESRNFQLNQYHPHYSFQGELLETFRKIIAAMNCKNYDNSNSQIDYFDVGYYIGINIGKYNKPFVVA